MAKKSESSKKTAAEIPEDQIQELYGLVHEMQAAQSLSPDAGQIWKPLLELFERQQNSIDALKKRLEEIEGVGPKAKATNHAEKKRAAELAALVSRNQITTFFPV